MPKIELRWLIKKDIPFDRFLQFREIEEGEDGYFSYGSWQNVPVEQEA